MKNIFFTLLALVFVFCGNAQGLENVYCEVYYVSDANDATDTDGGFLEEGSITYRIFVDMADGYELQAVYGNDDHLLRIETSTVFFNNEDRGEETGDNIPDNRLDENTVALDSYVTMLAASEAHAGILKTADTDGSIIGGVNNDGGSEGIDGGLLVNEDPFAGIPLTTADGMIEADIPSITVVGLDLGIFFDENAGTIFSSTSGAWSVLEGVQGPTDDNVVMIAQLTTAGELSFEMNIQLGTPEGETEQYVASNPIGDEQYFPNLNFPHPPVQGCMSDTACNFDPEAEEDDGSCLEPVENCSECDGMLLIDIDTDGDGVCDAEEIEGCTSNELACNYNPEATDEVDCLIPIEDCVSCNDDNTGLVLIDDDEDGICNADEVLGCDNPDACNYDEFSTEDDGSCLVPEENCLECNEDNTALILIDEDNDGICDALENPGCNIEGACNYDPEATSDDGSCLIPEENCSLCNENNDGLILIDTDEDGICDAEEIEGCTSESACNYSADATEEDGSCLEPVEDCSECDGTELVDIDTDGDGVCDGEEIFGCTDPEAENYNPEATEDDGSCTYVGVEELDNDILISIYPNPTSGNLNIELEAYFNAQATLTVLNILGEKIEEENINVSSSNTLYNLQIENQPDGIYFIQISLGSSVRTLKVLKN